MKKFLLACVLVGAPSCSILEKPYTVLDDQTGAYEETTVGEIAADAIDASSTKLANIVSYSVGTAAGNPIIGAGAGAALIALLGLASKRLRRKKAPAPSVDSGASQAPSE